MSSLSILINASRSDIIVNDSVSIPLIESSNGQISPESERAFSLLQKINPFIFGGKSITKDTGILPPGVLYVDNDFVIFERPPEQKNLFIIGKVMSEIRDKDLPNHYMLPLPWQVYIVRYSSYKDEENNACLYPVDIKMHFMPTNLYSFDQEVFMAPLPNFYTDGMLCRPFFASMEEMERYSKDIAGVVAAAYDWIWNAGTNMDLTESVVQYYLQLKRSLKTVYPLPRWNAAYGQRYCGTPEVHDLMISWEKFSLTEVLNVDWPVNTIEHSYADAYHANYRSLLLKYMEQNFIEPIYNLHEPDEDSDPDDDYYQCDDEHCECQIIHNKLNTEAVEKFMAEHLPSYTLRTSLESFIKFSALNPNVVAYDDASASAWVENVSLQLENNG